MDQVSIASKLKTDVGLQSFPVLSSVQNHCKLPTTGAIDSHSMSHLRPAAKYQYDSVWLYRYHAYAWRFQRRKGSLWGSACGNALPENREPSGSGRNPFERGAWHPPGYHPAWLSEAPVAMAKEDWRRLQAVCKLTISNKPLGMLEATSIPRQLRLQHTAVQSKIWSPKQILPSGILTWLWKITTLNGQTHYFYGHFQ